MRTGPLVRYQAQERRHSAPIAYTEVARPKRFELLTPRFVVWCSSPTRPDTYSHQQAKKYLFYAPSAGLSNIVLGSDGHVETC
jgi:hypothetical protein